MGQQEAIALPELPSYLLAIFEDFKRVAYWLREGFAAALKR
jgi:hypothetical protein